MHSHSITDIDIGSCVVDKDTIRCGRVAISVNILQVETIQTVLEISNHHTLRGNFIAV